MPELPEHNTEITCFRCGECCRKYQVLLEREELRRLADYLHISASEFIEKYSDPCWPGTIKYLVRQVEGACPFLRGDDKEFLCSVHVVKPGACRAWAASQSQRECRQGLKRYWNLSLDSAGEVNGKPDDVRAFKYFLKACEA